MKRSWHAVVPVVLGIALGATFRAGARPVEEGNHAAPHAIGTVAMFWFIERVAAFF